MNRIRLGLTAGVVAVVTGALVVTSGWAQPPAQPTSLHLVATTQNDVGFGPRHNSPTAGDRFATGDRITGDDTGIDRVICTVVATSDGLCIASLRLSKGTLTAQTLVSFTSQPGSKEAWAITGGTGAYDGARGTAIVTDIPDTPKADIQITLRP
jgi:hypothetical protein